MHSVLIGPGGRAYPLNYPGGCLHFEKMIDEHIAIYEVLLRGNNDEPNREIAVFLADSNPPNPATPWRIVVRGPLEVTTVMGATLTITAVRFRGYDNLPNQ